MSAETFVEADIWTIAQTDQGNVVLVRPKGSDLAVPIIIGQLETQSILIGMGGVEVPRPLTHDLAVSLLKALSASLLRIEINDLQEGTFYARLVLRQEGEEIVVDARPSDAIGIAVRTGCPVFISEAVVDEAGISVNLVTEADRSGDESPAEGMAGGGEEGEDSEGPLGEAGGDEAREGEEDGNGQGDETGLVGPEDVASGVASTGEGGGKGQPPRLGRGGLSRLDGADLPESVAQSEEARLLREELEEAIAVEDYERAAFLRDRIRSLGG
jgi:bifunctional DNase/RNase